MAFTATQKDTIRQYLGFAAGFYDLNTRFESMLDTIGSDSVAQTSVEAILTKLATVETAIASSGSSTSTTGALKEITGDVAWYPPEDSGGSSIAAPEYGRALLNRLAERFFGQGHGLPLNYFSGATGGGGEMLLG